MQQKFIINFTEDEKKTIGLTGINGKVEKVVTHNEYERFILRNFLSVAMQSLKMDASVNCRFCIKKLDDLPKEAKSIELYEEDIKYLEIGFNATEGQDSDGTPKRPSVIMEHFYHIIEQINNHLKKDKKDG